MDNLMKSKDYVQELNGLTTDKLLDREKELKEQLFNLRFQLATGQLENTASLKKVRKDIARVKTVLRQQELNK
ncbi:hypothetical protein FC49_GL000693 [Limosilactobacillus oris DSM 4864]|uniref:Large ribosomal subunit protein uL29 n=6 Tax=Limosilactobacillus TaxID=2742598 RepID=A0A0R1WF77_9LACO|nr:hypothetical protein FC31_GL000504 [Limosilactobacillus antri DSM 16041]KRM16590.1 hypothetical protein FC49_GL000693 [Limosilactobacillus oris DSM 4864]